MDLNPVKPFLCDDTTSTDLGPLWQKWKRSFDYFAIGKGVTDSRRKRALLLHCAGPQVQDIFDTLPDKGYDRNFDAAVTALDKHFNPLVNKFYERHKFRQMAQQDRDSVYQFIARLRQQAARCQYADTEQNLLDQLIEKCKNTKVRTKLLEAGNDLTLVQALSIARTAESVTLQEQAMASPSAFPIEFSAANSPAYQISTSRTSLPRNKPSASQSTLSCYRCGTDGHLANNPDCPARTVTCQRCGFRGHYALK